MKVDDGRVVARSASWVLALELLFLVVLIGGSAILAYQTSLKVAKQTKASDTANKALLTSLQRGNQSVVDGVRDLLDRPVLSVKTIRRVVRRQGVRTIIVTRTITRERIVYRIKVICRLPNGKSCPTTSG